MSHTATNSGKDTDVVAVVDKGKLVRKKSTNKSVGVQLEREQPTYEAADTVN